MRASTAVCAPINTKYGALARCVSAEQWLHLPVTGRDRLAGDSGFGDSVSPRLIPIHPPIFVRVIVCQSLSLIISGRPEEFLSSYRRIFVFLCVCVYALGW